VLLTILGQWEYGDDEVATTLSLTFR